MIVLVSSAIFRANLYVCSIFPAEELGFKAQLKVSSKVVSFILAICTLHFFAMVAGDSFTVNSKFFNSVFSLSEVRLAIVSC